MELCVEMKNKLLSLVKFIEAPAVPRGATTRHFYLVRQAAEKLARKRVFEWHNYPIRGSSLLKCQLEYDRIAVNDLSSSDTTASVNNQRLRTIFERKYTS